MPVHLIRLTVLDTWGAVENVSVKEIVAADAREAMALVVRTQAGWFSVEVADNLRSPEPRGDETWRARTAGPPLGLPDT